MDGELVNVKNIQTVIFVGNKVTAPGSEETWVKLEDVGEYRNRMRPVTNSYKKYAYCDIFFVKKV